MAHAPGQFDEVRLVSAQMEIPCVWLPQYESQQKNTGYCNKIPATKGFRDALKRSQGSTRSFRPRIFSLTHFIITVFISCFMVEIKVNLRDGQSGRRRSKRPGIQLRQYRLRNQEPRHCRTQPTYSTGSGGADLRSVQDINKAGRDGKGNRLVFTCIISRIQVAL